MPKPPVNPFINDEALNSKLKAQTSSLHTLLTNAINLTDEMADMTAEEFSEEFLEAWKNLPHLSKKELKRLLGQYEAFDNIRFTSDKEEKEKEKVHDEAVKALANLHYNSQILSRGLDLSEYTKDLRPLTTIVLGTGFSLVEKRRLLKDITDPQKCQSVIDAILNDYIQMDITPYTRAYSDEELAKVWPEIGPRVLAIGMEAKNFIAQAEEFGKSIGGYTPNEKLVRQFLEKSKQVANFYSFYIDRLSAAGCENYSAFKDRFVELHPNEILLIEDVEEQFRSSVQRLSQSNSLNASALSSAQYAIHKLTQDTGRKITAVYDASGKELPLSEEGNIDFAAAQDFVQGKNIFVAFENDPQPICISGNMDFPPDIKYTDPDLSNEVHKKVCDDRLAKMKAKFPDYEEAVEKAREEVKNYHAALDAVQAGKTFDLAANAPGKAIAEIAEKYRDPYFNAVLKEKGLNEHDMQLAGNILNSVRMGKTEEELKKDPALQSDALQAALPDLIKAAEVDLTHHFDFRRSLERILDEAVPVNSSADRVGSKNLGSAIEKIGGKALKSSQLAEQEQLRREFLSKLKAKALEDVLVPKTSDRGLSLLLKDPSLLEEQRLDLLELTTTPKGQAEYYRRLAAKTLEIDVNELRKLTLQDYVKNYDKYAFLRDLTIDNNYVAEYVAEGLKKSGYTEKEAELYKKHMQAAAGILNILDGKSRLLADPALSKYNFDNLTLDKLAAAGLDDQSLKALNSVMILKQDEMGLEETVREGLNAKAALLQKNWISVLKQKPGLDKKGIDDLDDILKDQDPRHAKDNREALYVYALMEIKDAYMKPRADQSEYLSQLKAVSGLIHEQIKQDGFEIDAEDLPFLEMAEKDVRAKEYREAVLKADAKFGGDYTSVKEYREAILRDVEKVYKANPCEENLEAVMEAVKGNIENQIEYPSPRDCNETYRSICNTRLDIFTSSHVREALKLIGAQHIDRDFACRIASGMSAEDIRKALTGEKPVPITQYGYREEAELVLKNADLLAKAAQYDKNNLQYYKDHAREMFRNMKEEDISKIESILKEKKVPLLSEKERTEYARYQAEIKEAIENHQIGLAGQKVDGTNIRHLNPLFGKPGVTEGEKEIINRAFSGSKEDLYKCYDMALKAFRDINISEFEKESSTIEGLSKNYDKLQFIYTLVWDGENLFKDIDAARKAGKYSISEEELNAYKEFRAELDPLMNNTKNLYNLYSRQESLLVDPMKMTLNNALDMMKSSKISPSLVNYGSILHNFVSQKTLFSRDKLIASQNKLMNAVATAKLDNCIKASVEKISKGFENKDGASMRDGVSEIMYFSGLKKDFNKLGAEKTEAMLKEDSVKAAVQKLNPLTMNVLKDIPVEGFQKALKASDQLINYMSPKFGEAVKNSVKPEKPQQPAPKEENKTVKHKSVK